MSLQSRMNQMCKSIDSKYSATCVSWNDNQRAPDSCWGTNITDARLTNARTNSPYIIVRPDNFNETIGKVKASEVALLVPREDVLRTFPLTSSRHDAGVLVPTTLRNYLQNIGKHLHHYMDKYDLAPTSLFDEARDENMGVGIRFQAAFVPLDQVDREQGLKYAEFYPETYNYQTGCSCHPKNMVALCTSQGTFIQGEGKGFRPQFLQEYSSVDQGMINYNLKATPTRHGVVLNQVDTDVERTIAQAQGLAVSTVIGTRAMGTGFNRLMTIQIPLSSAARYGCCPNDVRTRQNLNLIPCGSKPFPFTFGAKLPQTDEVQFEQEGWNDHPDMRCTGYVNRKQSMTVFANRHEIEDDEMKPRVVVPSPPTVSSARVSYGSKTTKPGHTTNNVLATKDPRRDNDCSITITVQFYIVYEKDSDITPHVMEETIQMLHMAYSGCSWSGNLHKPKETPQQPKTQVTQVDPAAFAKTVGEPAELGNAKTYEEYNINRQFYLMNKKLDEQAREIAELKSHNNAGVIKLY